jgi:hypothetical protein
MTLRQFLEMFNGMLQNDFQSCVKNKMPKHPSYPLADPNLNASTIGIWMTRVLQESPDLKYLRTAPYTLWFAARPGDQPNDLRFLAAINERHPLYQYASHDTPGPMFNQRLIQLVRSPLEFGPNKEPAQLFSELSVYYTPEMWAEVCIDDPISKLLRQLDIRFYRDLEPFVQNLMKLDDLQADRQPEENQLFAQAMLSFCNGIDRLPFKAADILDADRRLELLHAIEKNRPASLA